MSLTIGRAVLPDPSTVAPSGGGVLTLAGVLWSDEADSDDRATYVQMTEMQLLGCVDNPDEDVFPVVWDAEPKWDGFYRVLDASVDYVNDGSGRLAFANYSVTLERVVDSAVAKVEQYSSGLVRTNGHSITSVAHSLRFVLPPGIVDASQGSIALSSFVERPTEGGGNILCQFTSVSLPTSDPFAYWIAPSSFYRGACRIEYQAADDAWYPLVGRDLPPDSGGRWRITNGSFRLSPTATLGRWDASVFNGTSWESVTVAANAFVSSAHHEVSIGTNLTTWLVPTILRNSPDGVTLATSGTSSSTGRYDQVLTLRRGAYHVELTTWGTAGRPGVRAAATTASTALSTATLGLRATSDDANGNRLVLMSAPACVNDTTNGRIYVNDASGTNKHTFAIGVEYDGSSAVTRNTAIEVARQFIAPALVSSRVLKS